MSSGIHFNHEEKDFFGVSDQGSDGLAQFLMFFEVAPESDDVH